MALTACPRNRALDHGASDDNGSSTHAAPSPGAHRPAPTAGSYGSSSSSAVDSGPAASAGRADDGEPLRAEEPEANPASDNVTLKLDVQPRSSKAAVWWGRKRLGVVDPRDGKSLEIVRPRSSGPLDLLIKADGFLPYHSRLYTDRDDRLSVRLLREDEATGVLGWKPAGPPAGATP